MNNYFFTFTKYQQNSISQKIGFVKVRAENKELAIAVAGVLYPLGYSGVFSENNFIPQPYQVLLETVTQIFR